MFVELHLLQNFAPSNLNRDDTGSPKECEFGGHRRARISSQCFKRAVRMRFPDLLPGAELAKRTKRIVLDMIVPALEKRGHLSEASRLVAEKALASVSLKVDEEYKTQYLLFMGQSEIDALIEACDQHFDALAKDSGKQGKQSKKEAQAGVPDEVRQRVETIIDGGKAADLALFGRMLADLPHKNIDAAAQVAHAISTHRVSPEFDYYTAVDDLNPKEESGAGMIGTVEYNSACFYRYSNVDLRQLSANLKGDSALARRTVEAFLRASIDAVPSGKQNSTAAQDPPAFVMTIVRDSGLWSLANAFLNPVRPGDGTDLMQKSIDQLDTQWNGLARMYGVKSIKDVSFASLDSLELPALGKPLATVDEVIAHALDAAKFAA
jgi:CRISPR system Cascade subunit CasC